MVTELKCPHCHKGFVPTIEPYQDAYILIDTSHFKVMVGGERVRLTATEHRLLSCLVANAGCILERRQILASVWGWEYINDLDHLRVFIWHLRRKIEPDPAHPQYIFCVKGIGYYFKERG